MVLSFEQWFGQVVSFVKKFGKVVLAEGRSDGIQVWSLQTPEAKPWIRYFEKQTGTEKSLYIIRCHLLIGWLQWIFVRILPGITWYMSSVAYDAIPIPLLFEGLKLPFCRQAIPLRQQRPNWMKLRCGTSHCQQLAIWCSTGNLHPKKEQGLGKNSFCCKFVNTDYWTLGNKFGREFSVSIEVVPFSSPPLPSFRWEALFDQLEWYELT